MKKRKITIQEARRMALATLHRAEVARLALARKEAKQMMEEEKP